MAVHRYVCRAARGAAALWHELPRARFIPIVNHFFVANLALFWLFLTLQIDTALVARMFYVWVAIFSLFSVAVFWWFMADIYSRQGKQLLGFSAPVVPPARCSATSPSVWLSGPLGTINLLIVAIILIEAAICVWRLEQAATIREGGRAREKRLGGGAFAALPELIRSPYLIGIAAWITLQSFCATMLYFEQIHLVAAEVHDAGVQTGSCRNRPCSELLTLARSSFATGQLLKRFGAGVAAGALPAVYIAGLSPSFSCRRSAVLALQVAQRWLHFAFANPARQVFYTVLAGKKI